VERGPVMSVTLGIYRRSFFFYKSTVSTPSDMQPIRRDLATLAGREDGITEDTVPRYLGTNISRTCASCRLQDL
jgi:hypothetical protein